MERFGLVGLANAGKSSLFNALTGGGALAAAYPFATVDPNVGVAPVPDERVERLGAMSGSARVVHAAVGLVDIGGLVEGSSRGEGLGNRFLGGIREVDAVVLVLRAFPEPAVVGPTDPVEHLATLETELALADLASVEARLERQRKAARADPSLATGLDALDAAHATLAEGTPLYRSALDPGRRAALRPWSLLTDKPVLAVVNLGEGQLAEPETVAKGVVDAVGPGTPVLPVCVQLEAEAAQLPPEERAEVLAGLGLGEGALPRFARAAHELLGRRTFLTTRPTESAAWTFRAGSTARQCAGLVHSDFERGFVKAECIRWDELLEQGSWSAARELGRVRMEGREYEVADGDVIEFRFNV